MHLRLKTKLTKLSLALSIGFACLISLNVNANLNTDPDNEKPITSHLSKEEMSLINQKKDAILYMLMENDELRPYLDALKAQEAERLKKEELQSKFPFTSDDIKERRVASLENEKAINAPLIEKKIIISEEPYDPDSRETIVINVAANNPSSLSFFDYEGNPWPIAGDVIGNTEAYTSTVFTANKNVAVFSILKRFSESVALVNLEGLQNLVVIKLVGNEEEIDSDKRIRVNRLSPLVSQEISVVNSLEKSQHNPIFDKLLSGDYSETGTELYVLNNPDRNNVYIKYKEHIYLRVKQSVIFPDAQSHHISTNGFNLYKLKDTNTITMNVNGEYKIYTLREKL